MNDKSYDLYTDEQILMFIKKNDKQAQNYLINKYSKLVRIKSRAHFMTGADTEDIIQEGMIGLFKAIRDFDDSKGGFYNFATLCIDRQIFTAIKTANRKKHFPLNSYFSLSLSQEEFEKEHKLIEKTQNPEQILIAKENYKGLKAFIKTKFSKLEKQVLSLYLQGKTYAKISEILNKDQKAVDNAIQRIRHKIINQK